MTTIIMIIVGPVTAALFCFLFHRYLARSDRRAGINRRMIEA